MKLNKHKFNEFLLKNSNKIEFSFNLAKGLKEFTENKNYFSLIQCLLAFIKIAYIDNLRYSSDLLSAENGWEKLNSKYGSFPTQLFLSALDKYDSINLPLKYDRQSVKIYDLKKAKLAYVHDYYYTYFFFKNDTGIKTQEIIDLLVEMKMAELDCQIFSFHCEDNTRGNNFTFKCEDVSFTDSFESNKYVERLLLAQQNNMCRSILFYGPPGTGKSTIINNIVRKLNYRTLLINFGDIHNYNEILFLIENFKIESIVIDDFDLTATSAKILKFLEEIRTNIKLVLASANSLKAIYPPLIRPGRFDEVIKIDHLDEKTIINALGSLSGVVDKVKTWPIAYINELVLRHKLDSNTLEQDIIELSNRYSKQLEQLSK